MDQRGFRQSVQRDARSGHGAQLARDMDDPAAALRAHDWHNRLAGKKGGGQIDRDQTVEFDAGVLAKRVPDAYPGIVDQDVDPGEARVAGSNDAFGGARLFEIGYDKISVGRSRLPASGDTGEQLGLGPF